MASHVSAQEQEFTARLDELEHDARAAARFTYAAATIDHLRCRRPTLADALDREAGFWETVLGALQTSAISAVARIYDAADGIMSADRLIEHAAAHSMLFSRLALQSRKARSRTVAAAIESSSDAYEPQASDFAALRAALDEHIASYDAVVRPIRFELFTESGRGSPLDTIALFQVAPRAAFDALALFPSSLCGALRRLFDEGRKPALEAAPTDVAAMIASPASGPREAAWEQRHMVLETWRFLADLEDSAVSDQERVRRRGYED